MYINVLTSLVDVLSRAMGCNSDSPWIFQKKKRGRRKKNIRWRRFEGGGTHTHTHIDTDSCTYKSDSCTLYIHATTAFKAVFPHTHRHRLMHFVHTCTITDDALKAVVAYITTNTHRLQSVVNVIVYECEHNTLQHTATHFFQPPSKRSSDSIWLIIEKEKYVYINVYINVCTSSADGPLRAMGCDSDGSWMFKNKKNKKIKREEKN